VPTPVNSQHVDERLEELYRRHLLVGEDSVANYYESGRGYYKPELAAEERERRCSSTALLWQTTEEAMS
jgi:hypothetical protein